MEPKETLSADLALELVRSMDRLRSRIRSETGMHTGPWSRSQLAALYRVVSGPPATTSDLAAAEYMRPQSMAQTLAVLEKNGLVTRSPDPTDGRRVLFSATQRGREEAERWLQARETWLTEAIDFTLTDEERSGLTALTGILERLADSDAASSPRRSPRSTPGDARQRP
ncbi:MarR family winged helix-turn-helix transcriptional regulator [Streptomyces sp. NPDC006012]|uniref:MarR family winged helix-turn-helix transcriptional regulator n=1 Tax=Streptomyces sp. NPDC006012 TaxID=3364739 RepID=UPI0036C13A9B